MNGFPVSVLALSTALFIASPAAAAGLSGTWKINAAPVSPICRLVEVGTMLGGACQTDDAEGPASGTIDGTSIKFTWNWNSYSDSRAGSYEFSGTQNGTAISGTIRTDGSSMAFTAALTGGPNTVLPPAPETVWARDASGIMRHQQSGMECPLMLGGFVRQEATLYDKAGMNVGCNYRDRATGSLVTVYLVQFDVTQLAAAFEENKKTLLAVPGTTAREAAVPIGSSLTWLSAGFARNEQTWSDLYMAALPNWMFKFRATFRPRDAAAVSKALTEIAAHVEKTAGAHLAACAALPPPVRGGTRITDAKRISDLAILGAMSLLVIQGTAKPDDPAHWCTEGSFQIGPKPYVVWRPLAPAAPSSSGNEAVLSFLGSTVMRISALDGGTGVRVVRTPHKEEGTLYYVLLESNEALEIAAVYSGQPDGLSVANAAYIGNVRVYARIGKKDNKITLFTGQ